MRFQQRTRGCPSSSGTIARSIVSTPLRSIRQSPMPFAARHMTTVPVPRFVTTGRTDSGSRRSIRVTSAATSGTRYSPAASGSQAMSQA